MGRGESCWTVASKLSTFSWQENRCKLLRWASGFTYSLREGSSDLCQAVQKGPCIPPLKPNTTGVEEASVAPGSCNKCRPALTVSVLSAPLSSRMTAVAINPYLFLSCGASVEDVMDSKWLWFYSFFLPSVFHIRTIGHGVLKWINFPIPKLFLLPNHHVSFGIKQCTHSWCESYSQYSLFSHCCVARCAFLSISFFQLPGPWYKRHKLTKLICASE